MTDTERIAVDRDELAGLVAELCPGHGLDLAGALPLPHPLPHADRFRSWLEAGRDGGLEYMHRDPDERLDPTRRREWARTLLVFAQGYVRGWKAKDADPSAGGDSQDAPWTARVARYARGADYHDVLAASIRKVVAGLANRWPGMRAHVAVDSGPFLEREYAWLAGLGFLGRNTCLIHERLGSGLFLGVAVTNLVLEGGQGGDGPLPDPLFGVVPRRSRPHPAYLSACGSCTRCLDACPTGALDAEHGLDASACISTWTIEQRGRVPREHRTAARGMLFGCDICQAVCPWNRRAAGRELPPVSDAYAPLTAHAELDLADLADLADDEFRRRFRRTPLWRCHPEGMRRNARRILEDES